MKTKVRLVIELDSVDLTESAQKDLDNWISALTGDVERDLKNGEIISRSFWQWFNPNHGDGVSGWDWSLELENYQ